MHKGLPVPKLLWILIFLATPFCSSTAFAHTMYLFAEADGATIRGEAYFRGGTPVRNATVTAFDPAGEEIGQAQTDEQGVLTLEARFRCDHRLCVQTADGHGAEFLLQGNQLPADLPLRGEAPNSSENCGTGSEKRPPTAADEPGETPEAANDSEQLESILRRIDQLQERLSAYQNEIRQEQQRTRFRDLLGGIGWILGIAGIAFYLHALRRGQSSGGA